MPLFIVGLQTDVGGGGNVMGQPATEDVFLGCCYRQACVLFACQSNEGVDKPERT